MKTQIIQLDNHDDLISARDKMAWSKAPRILLIWPQKGELLERAVDMLILQRYGQSLGAQIGIVSKSAAVQARAQELGIPCFRGATQAQKQVWRRPRGKKRLNLHLLDRKPMAIQLRELFSHIASERNTTIGNPWMRTGLFSLGILAVLVLAFLFMPSADIRLSPDQREQRLELGLRASPDIPAPSASGGLPAFASSVVVEGSDLERSSGKTSVPKTQASGMVEISNLGQDEVFIPSGTIFATTEEDARRYVSARDVHVAAGLGSKAVVEVRALIPGTQGNMPAGAIRALEGPLGLLVAVENPQPVSGGSDQVSSGPTRQDYERLRERLVGSLRQTAIDDLKRDMGPGKRLLENTVTVVKIINETLSPPAGEPGDFARLSMQVEFSAWFVNEDDLQTVARSALEANREEGYVPRSSPVRIEFMDEPEANEAGDLLWNVRVSRDLRAEIDPERVARAVTWKTLDDARSMLKQNYLLTSPAEIRIFPSWWSRLPFLSFRIRVEAD